MIVGIIEISFHIAESHSLKEKRKVVRSIKDRIRHHFNVSLVETEGQTSWHSCCLAAAMVAMQRAAIEREFDRIVALIESVPEIDRLEHWIDYT